MEDWKFHNLLSSRAVYFCCQWNLDYCLNECQQTYRFIMRLTSKEIHQFDIHIVHYNDKQLFSMPPSQFINLPAFSFAVWMESPTQRLRNLCSNPTLCQPSFSTKPAPHTRMVAHNGYSSLNISYNVQIIVLFCELLRKASGLEWADFSGHFFC